ncbi:MAG: DUF4180 domain-containing protein [Bacteroidales bacterium]
MQLNFFTRADIKFAELQPYNYILKDLDDFLDLLGNADYHYADCIIVRESNLNQEFFDLKTGFAGEVLQKFSTYNHRLAIVGDFSKYKSNSLQAFIRESNRQGRILFTEKSESAVEILCNSGIIEKNNN